MTEREPGSSAAPEEICGTSTSALQIPNQGEPDLVVVANPDRAAGEAADRIAAALIAAAERRGRADFCTTGGRISISIYRLLAGSPLVERIPWPQVHVWWGDDRFVPRGHPESNVTALDEVLLGGGSAGGAPLPRSNVHPFPTDRALAEGHDSSWCAARYAEELGLNVRLLEGNWPAFDLILAGLGDDGHVLSCFPGSPALTSMAWTMGVPAPTHIGPHLPRVTINPRMLEAAPVLVVTWGAGKAGALGHVFGDTRDDRRWPVQRTRRAGATWIVDEAAAAQIPARLRA
ncbi:MAG: 6-phosphogluconolactonase [Candidatus Limnocylindrales bacterium]|jgi:6-phosphogluconolactonase